MQDLPFLLPHLFLLGGSLFILMLGLWHKNTKTLFFLSCVFSLLGLYAYQMWSPVEAQTAFSQLFVWDPFAKFFAIFLSFVVFLSILLAASSGQILKDRTGEYCALILMIQSALTLMASSNHFLMLYMSIESVSLLSFALVAFKRGHRSSSEAGMKYVIYGSLASAVMLYGFSLLYGISGQLSLTDARLVFLSLQPEQISPVWWVSLLMILVGIGFKISIAPMHMWTPDVYEGAPTPVTALLSVAPKAAGFALLMRLLLTVFTPLKQGEEFVNSKLLNFDSSALSFAVSKYLHWPSLLLILSLCTMFVANLAALMQTSVKRILAYSSIAHAGLLLLCLSVGDPSGLSPILFYFLIYCLMNMGAFWVCLLIEKKEGGEKLKHFKGLSQKNLLLSVCMAVFLCSLVGLPPFAGFIAKYQIFAVLISKKMYGITLLAGLNTVISLYYYLNIIKVMFLENPETPVKEQKVKFASLGTLAVIVLLALPNVFIGLGLYLKPLIDWSKDAVKLLVG